MRNTTPLRILIANDEASIRFVLKHILENAGYVVFEASNGAEACQKALDLEVELVIIDMIMLIMDGMDLDPWRCEIFSAVLLILACWEQFTLFTRDNWNTRTINGVFCIKMAVCNPNIESPTSE